MGPAGLGGGDKSRPLISCLDLSSSVEGLDITGGLPFRL